MFLSITQDRANTIDGRWIDMTNSKFIDTTAVRSSKARKRIALHVLITRYGFDSASNEWRWAG